MRDRLAEIELDRALRRVRLVGIALGATILVLAPRSDQTAAALALSAYALVVVAERSAAGRGRTALLAPVRIALDIGFATALVLLLPFSAGTWALYALAVATAGLRYGPLGAVAAAAGSVAAYDVALGIHAEELRAADLWPVQVLLAFGLIAAELTWAIARARSDRGRLQGYALAQRNLAAAPDEDGFLERLVDHAVRTFGARAAWVEGSERSAHHRGGPADASAGEAGSIRLELDPPLTLRAQVAEPHIEAALRDLAADVAPVLASLRERARLRHAAATATQADDALRRLARAGDAAAVLAEVVTAAGAIAGPAAIARTSDGAIIAGGLSAADVAALAGDVVPPALLRGGLVAATGHDARTAAVVPAGDDLVLVAVGTRRALCESDLAPLAALAEAAAALSRRIAERDALARRSAELERALGALRDELRARDDAVASAVHELRNPLTSVHAYAQLMARSLQAVQRQVGQLDRLIEDLLHLPGAPAAPLVLEPVDVAREARDAANRLRVVAQRTLEVSADRSSPLVAQADPARFAQVLDNLLRNAASYSPPETSLTLSIDRQGAEIVVAVSDRGDGVAPEEQGRIFERYRRGGREELPGRGIGLAVTRDIVRAHGGRIWMTSPGRGQGSTFFVAVPAAAPIAIGSPPSPTGIPTSP